MFGDFFFFATLLVILSFCYILGYISLSYIFGYFSLSYIFGEFSTICYIFFRIFCLLLHFLENFLPKTFSKTLEIFFFFLLKKFSEENSLKNVAKGRKFSKNVAKGRKFSKDVTKGKITKNVAKGKITKSVAKRKKSPKF
jgi:hypothetical protein